jgi:succinate dehydrogenase / fumarate reductase membrane anchor subunit
MINTPSTPKPGESTTLWFIKLITGPILLIIAFIHVVVNHYIGSIGGLLSHAEVVAYYQNWYIPVMEAIFLITVISHCLIGLRGIILDLKPSAGLMKVLDWIFILGGAGFVVYGLWLLRAIAQLG